MEPHLISCSDASGIFIIDLSHHVHELLKAFSFAAFPCANGFASNFAISQNKNVHGRKFMPSLEFFRS
jgi:hypothetical protein